MNDPVDRFAARPLLTKAARAALACFVALPLFLGVSVIERSASRVVAAERGPNAPLVLGEPRARGLVRSLGEATISSELAARITELPYREGERFAAGDLLVAFDCDGYRAGAAGAGADLRAAQVGLDTAREMLKMKAVGQREVEMAEAKRDRAKADYDGMAIRLKGCEIRAPFAGSVVDRGANPHEVIGPSTPLLRVVDSERLELELIVSSGALGALQEGASFQFIVDETGGAYSARIVRLGAAVDPASQTLKAFGVFEGPHAGVLQGMSGTAIFSAAGGARAQR